ncbi:cell division protein FtsA [Hathewaya histolytica]|uniref:Cell division protein FtsA n=1 Tax=Hathewaya histolytica TaxID=1498 RepID=A0A4U9RET6_HATHI|nr:cell division protein FtsA [Hathewaya histolytica]VTQ90352.1 cell division protein FtsA [Hathewaya histolytica]
MYDYIVGLDIGSSKICASVGKINSQGSIQIMGITSFSCSGLKKGVVVDIDKTSKSIEKCIFQLEKIVQFKINEAFISIQSGICEFINNRGVIAVSGDDREITEGDVNRAIEAAKLLSIDRDKEIIGAVPEQFIIDGYDNIKDPIGMSGVKLEVEAKIVLAQSTIINNLIKSVNKAGIRVLGVTLQPIALSSVLLKKEEREKGVAIVDVGLETINISIFRDNKLQKDIFIPLGGHNITKDISLCLNISYEEAENLKLKCGSVTKNNFEDEKIILKTSKHDEKEVMYFTVIDIINARVEEMLKFMKAFIKESGEYEQIYNIVLVGGGVSLLKGIVDLSENIFKRPIRIGVPEYIGASNTLYAGSVGILKDVFDNTKPKNSLSSKKRYHKEVETEEEFHEENTQEKSSGFVSRIKEFFADFF